MAGLGKADGEEAVLVFYVFDAGGLRRVVPKGAMLVSAWKCVAKGMLNG